MKNYINKSFQYKSGFAANTVGLPSIVGLKYVWVIHTTFFANKDFVGK